MTARLSTFSISHPSRSCRKRQSYLRFAVLCASFFTLSLLNYAWRRRTSSSASFQSDVPFRVVPPSLPLESHQNKRRTLFILPGRENRCHYQYDYICKFWFYIRCYVFAAFPNVKMLSLGPGAFHELTRQARNGDIAAVIWRSKNHALIPQNLEELIQWQNHIASRNGPRLRIGVLHISNEKNRTHWPWYHMPDFVVRNYWIPHLPKHVTYVPLGHQLPNICTPWSTERLSFLDPPRAQCSCNGFGFKPASERKYLWNFSGSLRKKRALLLRLLRQEPSLKNEGFVQVSKKFGGDGKFGSRNNSPKTAYLESILESQFVFAPCGNVMETHRIYEAISLGAIPVIENCDPDNSYFFPYRDLLVNGGPEMMVQFVRGYLHQPEEVDALQQRVYNWWQRYSQSVARNVSNTILRHVPPPWKESP